MKKKFIFPLLAVILVISLIAFALPMLTTLPSVEAVAADESAVVMTADLAEIDVLITAPMIAPEVDVGMLIVSESILISEAEVPGLAISTISLWIALSASLLIIAVACRRRLYECLITKMLNLLRSGDSANERAEMGRGGRDCILPAAAA